MKKLSNIIIFLAKTIKQSDSYGFIQPLLVILQLILNKQTIKYKYKKHSLYINNDSINSVTYHIINSTPKIEKMVSKIDSCKTAVDIGANNGIFSYFLKKKFPDAVVYVFEPSDILQKIISQNLESYEKIILEKKAVSDIDGEISFFINPLSEQTNSLNKESVIKGNIKSLNKEIIEVKVPSCTLNSYFFNIDSIDVLKVDIQGAEYLMLKGANTIMPKTKMAFFEVSFLDEKVFNATDELRKYYTNFEVVNDVKMGADIMFYN